jgi:tetratricopeptide (TPR) repeat protein
MSDQTGGPQPAADASIDVHRPWNALAALAGTPQATDGNLAVINLESSRIRSWQVLKRWPDRPGTVERIVEEEQYRVQFLSDVTALDRLADLCSELCFKEPASPDAHLVAAQVASIRHHFADAKSHLLKAETLGASTDLTSRMRLTIAQASGESLGAVLVERREMAEAEPTLQNLVPLGAVLADIGEYEDADRTYLKAIRHYQNVSPFPLAWACFQLGVLWGETAPERDQDRAGRWYERAIEYLPCYVRARVHLAEIRIDSGELAVAESLLAPAEASGDPEVNWRLAEMLAHESLRDEADHQRDTARLVFERILKRHERAFADHAAEFFLSAGADPKRALELAKLNLTNRPTLRAFELAHRAAAATGDERLASELAARARAKWGHVKAFPYSPVAPLSLDQHSHVWSLS